MRMLCITLPVLLISSVSADNEQISVSLVQDGIQDYRWGGGLGLAAQFGRNIVLATGLDWMPPTQQPQVVHIQSQVRLLYGAGLESQWYPGAAVQWSSADNPFGGSDSPFSGWLGAGIQHQGLSVFGLFAEGFWQPSTSDFQFRAGIRIWPARFSQLDNRIGSAKPLGATYHRSFNDDAATIRTTPNLNEMPLTAEAQQKTPPQVQQTMPPASGESSLAMPVSGAWYVHLGAFEIAESMTPILESLQGSGYQQQVLRWYDSSRDVYRLMIGPFFNAYEVNAAQQDLHTQGYDNFLYQAQ